VAGEVVIDDQRVAARTHEALGYCRRRVGSNVLQTRWFLGPSHHDDAILHYAAFAQAGNHTRHRVAALPDGAVN
jgi:hypothetical protein